MFEKSSGCLSWWYQTISCRKAKTWFFFFYFFFLQTCLVPFPKIHQNGKVLEYCKSSAIMFKVTFSKLSIWAQLVVTTNGALHIQNQHHQLPSKDQHPSPSSENVFASLLHFWQVHPNLASSTNMDWRWWDSVLLVPDLTVYFDVRVYCLQ